MANYVDRISLNGNTADIIGISNDGYYPGVDLTVKHAEEIQSRAMTTCGRGLRRALRRVTTRRSMWRTTSPSLLPTIAFSMRRSRVSTRIRATVRRNSATTSTS